jgi:hypothetical protein
LTKGFLQKETLKGCGCSKKRWHYNSPEWNGEKQLTEYEINVFKVKFQGKLLICEDKKKTIIIKIKLNNPEKQQRTKQKKCHHSCYHILDSIISKTPINRQWHMDIHT